MPTIYATVRDNALSELLPNYWIYLSREDLPYLGRNRASISLQLGEETWLGTLSVTGSHDPYLLTHLSKDGSLTTTTELVTRLGLGHEARLALETSGMGELRLVAVLDQGRPREEAGSRPISPVRHSGLLIPGEVYSRADLARRFVVKDATLNTGIFQPKGSSSIWLFVTEQKTPDRIQYSDRLEGDVLHWQGQASGRNDRRIIDHAANDVELLLFYRRERYEHAHAGFRYEGVFVYESHEGRSPASFLLRRAAGGELIGGIDTDHLVRGGQGFQLDSRLRRLIERHAVDAAMRHFEDLGWSVQDVGGTRPFDLLCHRDGGELRVEVKGTTQAGNSVLLTSGEVRHALDYFAGTLALYILQEISIDMTAAEPRVSGGVARVLTPWILDEAQLTPIAYEYRVL